MFIAQTRYLGGKNKILEKKLTISSLYLVYLFIRNFFEYGLNFLDLHQNLFDLEK